MSRFGPLVHLDPDAWVHDSAHIFGDVRLGPRVSVWPNAVIRSELHHVDIGEGSNVQDFVMIHVGYEHPTLIGRNCSVTHHATIHGATLEDDVLIGINATVMDGSVIGQGSVVAGNALVREGSVIPPHSIVAGVPAKVIATRDMTGPNRDNAQFYMDNARAYARGIHRMDDWPQG